MQFIRMCIILVAGMIAVGVQQAATMPVRGAGRPSFQATTTKGELQQARLKTAGGGRHQLRRLMQPTTCRAKIIGCRVCATATTCSVCYPGYTKADGGKQCYCPPGTYGPTTITATTTTPPTCTPAGDGAWSAGGSRTAATSADAAGARVACGTPARAFTTAASPTAAPQLRATSAAACRLRPGWRLASGGGGGGGGGAPLVAAACDGDTWSAGFSASATACVPCTRGLGIAPGTPPSRRAKEADCLVPSGSFYSAGRRAAVSCARGTFRTGFVSRTAAEASSCSTCARGLSTRGVGAASAAACTVLAPGFYATRLSSAARVPAARAAGLAAAAAAFASADVAAADTTTTTTGDVLEAAPCPYGSWYQGGDPVTACVPCRWGYTTNWTTAVSEDACMAPPGYFAANESGPLGLCGDGFYRAGWAATHLTGRLTMETACDRCGAGVASEPLSYDETPGIADDAPFVRGSAYCCYLPPGYGARASADGGGGLEAFLCPADTFSTGTGADGRTYCGATDPVACTPCPDNTRTKNRTGGAGDRYDCSGHLGGYGVVSTSSDGSDGGAPDGAAVVACDVGSYNPPEEDDFSACKPCGGDRTTVADPAHQAARTDCFPAPGFGLYLPPPSGSDEVFTEWLDVSVASIEAALNVSTSGAGGAAALLEALSVAPLLQCPQGFYPTRASWAPAFYEQLASADDRIALTRLARKCVPCPAGSTTDGEGAANAAACSLCDVGYERRGGACAPCAVGFWNDWPSGGPDDGPQGARCQECEQGYFIVPGEEALRVRSVTLTPGATSPDDCNPGVFSSVDQLPEAALFSGHEADFVAAAPPLPPDATFAACAAKCPNGTLCSAVYEPYGKGCAVASYGPIIDLLAPALALRTARDLPRFTLHVKLPRSGPETGPGFYVSATAAHGWDGAPASPDGALASPRALSPGEAAAAPMAALSGCRTACTEVGFESCVAFLFDAQAATCRFVEPAIREEWAGWYAGVVLAS